MTVAHVRQPSGADHVEVMFFESARIYRLPRANPAFAAHLEIVQSAAATGRPVTVTFATPEDDLIVDLI